MHANENLYHEKLEKYGILQVPTPLVAPIHCKTIVKFSNAWPRPTPMHNSTNMHISMNRFLLHMHLLH